MRETGPIERLGVRAARTGIHLHGARARPPDKHRGSVAMNLAFGSGEGLITGAPAFSAHGQPDWRNHMSQRSVARTLANQRQMPYGAKYINPQLGGPPPSLAAAILIFALFPLRVFRRA